MERVIPPYLMPDHFSGHVAPRYAGADSHLKESGLLRENTPDQMFQIANIALLELGESGPRMGVAGT